MHVLVVNGLDDKPHDFYFEAFEERGHIPEQYSYGYQSGERVGVLDASFRGKLEEKIATAGGKIAVVGLSAGGRGAFWALQEYPDNILVAINVCGIVVPTPKGIIRTLIGSDAATFDTAVAGLCPKDIDMNRAVTIRTPFDGLVPRSSTVIGEHRVIESKRLLHQRAIHYEMINTVPQILTEYA